MNTRLSRRIPAFVAAILLAAAALAAYRSSVYSQFIPIRQVVTAERASSAGALAVALPDLSPFGEQRAVVAIKLRNTGGGDRAMTLRLGSLPRVSLVLPWQAEIGWTTVLSPGAVRTLAGVSDTPRSLELSGDGDGWALSGLEIRNYHARVGERPLAMVVPNRTVIARPAPGELAVGLTLAILALLTLVWPRSESWAVHLVEQGFVLSAFLVVAACLVLPRLSPYKLLLSRPAFALVVAGLFAPVLLCFLQSAGRLLAACARSMAGTMRRHQTTCERGAAFLALGAIAIAQPIFDVVANSPEFFAARSTPPMTALAGVFAVSLGLPLMLLAIERAIRAINGRMATAFVGLVVFLLSAAAIMPWVRQSEVAAWPWDAAMCTLLGVSVAVAYGRIRVVRQFFIALAPAALVVPAIFLLNPAVSQALLPSESPAAVQNIARTPPIVFAIFDELPLNSLLDADGNIDAERYPNFAALARDAYWFRNASTVASTTSQAVPAILSGRYPTALNAAPTLRYYPVNLFTALARHYAIFAAHRFQQLCPPRACHNNSAMPGDTVSALLSDLSLVWLHIVLPAQLTEELPPVTDDWAEFVRPRDAREEVRRSRGVIFSEFLSSIDAQPSRLHFVHLVLPHMPFEYVPSGRRYRGPDYGTQMYRTMALFERASASFAGTLYQRHLAQVGFADKLVGDLMARLRLVGAYDNALIIVAADHGASYREGRSRRQPQQNRNYSDILRVPLLIKLPGQTHGEVEDRIVETVDIFPTLLDAIGANVSLRLDGRSLIDARVSPRSSRTYIARSRLTTRKVTIGDLSADQAESLKRKAGRFGRGDFGSSLYAPPEARQLLGLSGNDAAIHPARDVEIAIRNPGQFEAVDLASDPVPLYVGGVLKTSRKGPLAVAVVVNGTVRAVAYSYQERDAQMFGTLIPETSLRNGRNDVTALVVDAQLRPPN